MRKGCAHLDCLRTRILYFVANCCHLFSIYYIILETRRFYSLQHSPAHWKFSSHTDHICTVKNGAQQTMYAKTITKVILTVLSLALDIVVMLLTELFPISLFLLAAPAVVFLFLNLIFFHMVWQMNP